jgi:hypothetical protein
MRPAQVFISYRRDDTAGYARAICDELATHVGADRVFIDVDDIQPGQPFVQVIQREVGAAKVLLVLIGRRWRGEREGAPPRIEDTTDLVRREVAAGLASTARVIPVLIDGAAMPTEAQLPTDLRALAGRNALAIDNARYADDMNRLLAAVREALGEPAELAKAPSPTGSGRTARWVAVALLVAAVLAVADMTGPWLWGKKGNSTADALAVASEQPAAQALATRPDINGMWRAQVSYDWPGAQYVERFDLRGDASELHGTASFLGVPRGLLEGHIDAGELRFVTRTSEVADGTSRELVHRYRGRVVGGEIRFVMQTEGGSSSHGPVEFVARRDSAASAANSH